VNILPVYASMITISGQILFFNKIPVHSDLSFLIIVALSKLMLCSFQYKKLSIEIRMSYSYLAPFPWWNPCISVEAEMISLQNYFMQKICIKYYTSVPWDIGIKINIIESCWGRVGWSGFATGSESAIHPQIG